MILPLAVMRFAHLSRRVDSKGTRVSTNERVLSRLDAYQRNGSRIMDISLALGKHYQFLYQVAWRARKGVLTDASASKVLRDLDALDEGGTL